MQSPLQRLLADRRLRLAHTHSRLPTRASGQARLDACLPGGGFPSGALTEILSAAPGAGELSLLLPLLARLTREDATRVALVAPPHLPYAPALAQAGIDLGRLLVVRPRDATEALWASAQMARCGLFPAVLCWAPAKTAQLRRLQLAAETGDACLFLYRPARVREQASPAALRLDLEPAAEGTWVTVLKCRGPAGARVLCGSGPAGIPASSEVPYHPSANDPHGALARLAPAPARP